MIHGKASSFDEEMAGQTTLVIYQACGQSHWSRHRGFFGIDLDFEVSTFWILFLMNNIVVYTAIFGGYDLPPKVASDEYVDYILFSDRPIEAEGWEVVVVEKKFLTDSAENRYYKMLPHEFFAKYKMSVYIDGNIDIKFPVSSFVSEVLSSSDMALHAHHRAESVYDEFAPMVKYSKIGVADAVKFYKQQIKYEEDGYIGQSFVEANIIYRNHNVSNVTKAMELWLSEYSSGIKRDQLSLMYSLWKFSVAYNVLGPSMARSGSGYYSYRFHSKPRKKIIEKVVTRLVLLPIANLISQAANIYIVVKRFKRRGVR